MPSTKPSVSIAVEGIVDQAVATRLLHESGLEIARIYGRNGKADLVKKIAGYNQAARFTPWFVMIDMDHDAECAPEHVKQILTSAERNMCFRIAVRAVESWLLSDAESLAKFLRVASGKIPGSPDKLDNPKLTMVGLANHSSSRSIREDMLPRHGSGRPTGPAYHSRLIEYVTSKKIPWRPKTAARHSDSLRGCLKALGWLRRSAAS